MYPFPRVLVLAITTFLSLSVVPIYGHADETPTSPKWIYASKLPLSESADHWTAEGKNIRWFHAADYAKIQDGQKSSISAGSLVLMSSDDQNRAIWTKDENISIAFVYPTDKDHCTSLSVKLDEPTEETRPTAMESGVNTVIKIVKSGSGFAEEVKSFAGPATPPATPLCFQTTNPDGYQLKTVRGHLTMVIEPPSEKSAVKLITGPEENFFLSADVLTNKVSQLAYDSNTKTISEKAKPGQAFLSLNYQPTDIYSDAAKWSLDRVVYKFLITAGGKPLESIGVGVGYRFHDFDLSGDNAKQGGFMIFAGSFWTQGIGSAGRKQSWRVGMGYSVDSLLGWKAK